MESVTHYTFHKIEFSYIKQFNLSRGRMKYSLINIVQIQEINLSRLITRI